jgi:hypothetical protein
MNTYLEYQVHKLDTESLLEKGEFIESKRSIKEWIEDMIEIGKKYIVVIDILAKYFFKDGKIVAPSPLKFWVWGKLTYELYNFFKDVKDVRKIIS